VNHRRLGPKTVSLVLVSLLTAAFASGDSIFSVNGLGEISYPVGGQARGMGGVNVAFLDGRRVSFVNPAVIGAVDTTTVSALFLFEQRRIKDASSKSNINSWGPRFIRLIVPLSHGVVIGGGIAPFSGVNFHLSKHAEAFGEPYTLHVSAEGGTHVGSLTLAKNIGGRLFLGAGLNLIFGSMTEEWRRDFVNEGYVSSDDRITTSYYGQVYVGGMALRLHRRWSLGAVLSRSANINATIERSAASGAVREEEKRIDFPDAYGFGMTYRLTSRLVVGGDIFARQWETFAVDGAELPQYRNTVRLSLGCEMGPSADKMAPFYQRRPWRIGMYHEPWHYRDSSGNRPSETFLTLGTSLFFKNRRGVIDIAIEIGRRGDVTENGAQEWVFRQSFTVVGWERWFQQPEY